MQKYSYHHETLDVLTQFCAAFDDCFIYRYTKGREAKEKINVRYIFGPKDRIIHDIVTQNEQFTLPVIAINQTSIKRDPSRVSNKEKYMHRHLKDGSNNIARIPQPIPVILTLDVSIVAKFKEDIDQIVSNFIPYCNPYFIIAWKVPASFGMDFIDELRTEVTWSGDVSFENPTNLDAQDKYRIVGSTSFTLKAWIFPPDELPQAPIYTVRADFVVSDIHSKIFNIEDYQELPTIDYTHTDVITISAFPEFTNVFYTLSGDNIPVIEDITINGDRLNNFLINGKRFDYNNSWYLSSGNTTLNLDYEEITTARFPTISGYKLPESFITVYTDNIAVVSLSSDYIQSGRYTIVTANSAGWTRMGKDLVVI